MSEKKSELNEQNLEQVAGGSAEPTMTVTFACQKCGKQKTITCSELPESPSCCGQLMLLVKGITNW